MDELRRHCSKLKWGADRIRSDERIQFCKDLLRLYGN